MSFLAGFANLHPFFVHTPLVLIPAAALLVWLGLKIRTEGFETATTLITIGAALGAVAATVSGLSAEGTFPHDEVVHEIMEKHELNGIVLTVLTSIAALLAIAQWRGLGGKKLWWPRALILTFAAIGTVFSGHLGATMVFIHGAAVAPVSKAAEKAVAAPEK